MNPSEITSYLSFGLAHLEEPSAALGSDGIKKKIEGSVLYVNELIFNLRTVISEVAKNDASNRTLNQYFLRVQKLCALSEDKLAVLDLSLRCHEFCTKAREWIPYRISPFPVQAATDEITLKLIERLIGSIFQKEDQRRLVQLLKAYLEIPAQKEKVIELFGRTCKALEELIVKATVFEFKVGYHSEWLSLFSLMLKHSDKLPESFFYVISRFFYNVDVSMKIPTDLLEYLLHNIKSLPLGSQAFFFKHVAERWSILGPYLKEHPELVKVLIERMTSVLASVYFADEWVGKEEESADNKERILNTARLASKLEEFGPNTIPSDLSRLNKEVDVMCRDDDGIVKMKFSEILQLAAIAPYVARLISPRMKDGQTLLQSYELSIPCHSQVMNSIREYQTNINAFNNYSVPQLALLFRFADFSESQYLLKAYVYNVNLALLNFKDKDGNVKPELLLARLHTARHACRKIKY